MKGKTRCPKCQYSFVVDVPADKKKYQVTCPNCGYKFIIITDTKRDGEYKWEEPGGSRKAILPSLKKATERPTVASILLFISAILGIITAFMLIYNYSLLYNIFATSGIPLLKTMEIYRGTWFLLILILSGFGIAGGYASFNKKPLTMAMVGSIISIFSMGFLIVGPILSVLASILIFISRDEFENGVHGKEF